MHIDKAQRIVLVVIAAALALAVGWLVWAKMTGNDVNQAEHNERIVREVASTFGERLGRVSLSAPRTQAAEDIREHYADLVAPELLLAWAEDPLSAPGRLTSSPWPDHIEVLDVIPLEADAYEVRARVIYMTSVEEIRGGNAGVENVRIFVERRGGLWLIAQYMPVEDFTEPELEGGQG
jgi:hypothetical protein